MWGTGPIETSRKSASQRDRRRTSSGILAAERAGMRCVEEAGLSEHYRRDGRALPGAPEALAALAREPGVLQSVLTGNVRAHAEAKLGAVGLDRFIDFDAGAFGCDHVDRPRLVPIAQTRAGLRRKTTYDHAHTLLVGDTRRDVQAGPDG